MRRGYDIMSATLIYSRSLHELLEYEGNDVEEVFCLNFTVTQQYYDVTKSIPLKPDGEEIPVTAQNKSVL